MNSNRTLSRYDSITQIVESHGASSVYFITTGKASREFLQQNLNAPIVFPCFGGMGYVSSIAFSFAFNSQTSTICIDGDGSFLMHLGALPSFNTQKNVPFTHYLLDNGSHQSVGGGVTVGGAIDYAKLTQSLGYDFVIEVESINQLKEVPKLISPKTKSFIRVSINNYENSSIPRPSNKPIKFIKNFEEFHGN